MYTKQEKYFEITAFLNCEREANENKKQTNTSQKGGNFKIIFPLPYPIIYDSGTKTIVNYWIIPKEFFTECTPCIKFINIFVSSKNIY